MAEFQVFNFPAEPKKVNFVFEHFTLQHEVPLTLLGYRDQATNRGIALSGEIIEDQCLVAIFVATLRKRRDQTPINRMDYSDIVQTFRRENARALLKPGDSYGLTYINQEMQKKYLLVQNTIDETMAASLN
ncbi:MAG TPA: hypothetical protein VH234_06250 [Candidatus Saccharimonadales bacterium]|jgi:hypothetical protein|nr:hypothetical protein [Candidatus Saccharimonadales bacterium]